MAYQDEVRCSVLGQDTVETPDRHVGKQTAVRAQGHVERLSERENLRRLHGAHERARENQRDTLHPRTERGKVSSHFFSRLGRQRARSVIQALGNVGVRIRVPHQENLHPCLQPNRGPLPSVVHERAIQGQSLRAALALWTALLLCSAGCRTHPSTQTVSEAGPEVTEAAFSADAGPGPYHLTPAKLDAFLAYKRVLLEGGEPSATQLRELLRAVDAGEPDAVERAWAVLQAQGRREAAARAHTGLTSSEARVIESMAADVAAARLFVKPLGLGKLSEDLVAARNSVAPERRAALDATLEALREDEARVERLADEREAWGDANVDLLLTREKELVRLYEAQVRGARERLGLDAGR